MPVAERTSSRGLLTGRPERVHFSIAFLAVLGVLAVICYVAISTSVERARSRLLTSIEAGERQAVAAMRREAASTLLDVTADLLTFQAFYRRFPASDDARGAIEEFMLDFMQSHRVYEQMRFLGPDGIEEIRVDNRGSTPTLAEAGQLQDRSRSSYVQLAEDLGSREVLITPIAIHRDGDDPDSPGAPVMRIIGRATDDRSGAPGLIVFDYRAAHLLSSMRFIGEAAIGQPVIVNGVGEEVLSVTESEPGDAPAPRFAERYPAAWAALRKDATGPIDDGSGGIMIADRFTPADLTIPESIGADLAFTLPMPHSPERQGHWYIISHLDRDTLATIMRLGFRPSLATLSLLGASMLGLAWFVGLRLSSYRRDAERMRELATTDALTGLLNRGEFERRLTSSIALARRHHRAVALLYVDLDGFKAANDRFGHAAGDELLRHVAALLRDSVRESDMVARLGGDEFAIALSEVRESTDAEVVADKLRGLLDVPVMLAGGRWNAGGSVGGATFPEEADSLEALFARADEAMYAEKAARRERKRPNVAWAI